MTPVDPNDGAGVRELATLCGVIAKLRAQVDLLTAERDDARRQRDEAAALDRLKTEVETDGDSLAVSRSLYHAESVLHGVKAAAPATNDDARAILHTLASQPAHTEHVAVITNRISGNVVMARWGNGEGGELTTDEAAALVTALLADGAVHSRWLHGRGGK